MALHIYSNTARTRLISAFPLFCLLLTGSVARADTIVDARLGFELELPAGFVSRPDLVGITPDIVHAFQFGEATEDEIAVLLLIEKLGGVIGRERLSKEDMPPELDGDIFVTAWQEFEIDGFEVPENVNGIPAVTYNVQIPLKREAIQVKIFGPADREELLQDLLRQVLDGLSGESNWFSSGAPPSVANSENYGKVLLLLGIGSVVVGLIALWFLSRSSPKGTVLVIAAMIYFLSWQIDDIRVREVRLLTGSLRMLGFAGGILGVVDLLRRRPPKGTLQPPNEPE